MVDTQSLLDSKLAHVIAVVLGLVGIVALVASSAGVSFWFWIFYGLAWLTFLDLFEDDEAFWSIFGSDSESESETTETKARTDDVPSEDPLELLKRRYAEGTIDDDEFDERLDRLLDTPDTLRELELERSRS